MQKLVQQPMLLLITVIIIALTPGFAIFAEEENDKSPFLPHKRITDFTDKSQRIPLTQGQSVVYELCPCNLVNDDAGGTIQLADLAGNPINPQHIAITLEIDLLGWRCI